MPRFLLAPLLILIAGCAPGTPARSSYVKHSLGDRYFVELEDTGGNSSLTFNSSSSGMKVTKELYDLKWGKGKSLQIQDGKLTVNGEPHGELKQGDKIVVQRDGRVLVNGAERKATASAYEN